MPKPAALWPSTGRESLCYLSLSVSLYLLLFARYVPNVAKEEYMRSV